MKCPYCGNDMVKGYIQCRDGVYWAEKQRPVAAVPLLSGNVISLSSDTSGVLSGKSAIAYCCNKCRKIIVDY